MVRRAVGRLSAGLVAGALAIAGVAVATTVPAYADDPVPGALTAGDSLFPHQGNGGYDVSHYDISFRVDVTVSGIHNAPASTNLPNAQATIHAATTGAPLSSFSLDFQGSSSNLGASTLDVDSVTVNGVPAGFSRIENTTTSNATTDVHKLVVTPATPVDGAFTTVVSYHGIPVRHQDTDGSSEGWNNTTDGATFLNQPVGAMTLFPNNNTPRDTATYTFTIDAPTTLTSSNLATGGGTAHPAGVVSNGELVSRTVNGDRTTWVWDQAEPMASALSLVSVGRYDIYESDIHLELSNRTIHEWTFIDPAISQANQNTTLSTRGQLKAVLDFFESKYGPYPGNSTGLVTDVVPSAINYALETQDRPFFPNAASRGTTYHELMHQWWGDAVAPTDWNDITLNEGPARYSESQFPYEGAGSSANSTETAIYDLWNSTSPTSGTFTVAPAAMTQASQLFGSQVYNKGAMTLEALRTSIGAANFETLMRQYQLMYGGGQITGRRTAAFEDLAETISGRDLTAFFQTWWFTTGKPAWPAKFNLSLTGPTALVAPATPVTYTLTSRNTGKVAQTGSVVSVDLSDVLDDATVDTLPASASLDGTTLTWNVPTTAVGASSTADLQLLVNPTALGSTLAAVASATSLGGTCVDCAPSVVVGALPVIPAPAPTISGTPTVGTPLSAETGGWLLGTSFTYQWLVDGSPVAGATNATYTPAPSAAGLTVRVRVTGSNGPLASVTATSAATAAVAKATLASSPPTITGTQLAGVPLSVDPGAWEPGTVFTYQWTNGGSNVAGATGPVYYPLAGQTVAVTVTGTKFGFTTLPRTSTTTTAPIPAGPPLVLTPTPTFTGTPKVATLFTPSIGLWDDGVALTFQWSVNGVAVGGGAGTGATFTPTVAQLGLPVALAVTGTRPGLPPVTRTSASSAPIDPGTQVLQPTPTITGTPKVAVQLTAVPGTWDPGTTLAYQWTQDGSNIAGATTSTYTPDVADAGKLITVKVTSTRNGYAPVTKESAATAPVALGDLVLTPNPSFGGSAPKVGVTFTADPGTWDAGVGFAYQWTADGTDIAGATASTYTVTVGDLGLAIAVKVTGSKTGYNSVTQTSPASSNIEPGDLVATPVPTITGPPQVGEPLTAVPGTWDDGVELTYQWTTDGTDVPSATTSAYTPVAGDVGKVITVKVTGAKDGYVAVTTESVATAAVTIGGLVNTPTPTVSGTPQVAVQLTATAGVWDDGVTLAHQWTADGADIPGATSSTYTPVAGDVGKAITVKVTGSKAGFTSVTEESAPTAAVAKGDLTSTPTPTISGTNAFGELLVAGTGTWDAGTTLAVQWLVDGSPVAGAVGNAYLLRAEDVGKSVTVAVTGTKAGYNTVTRTSAPTGLVQARNLVDSDCAVDIKGKAKIGKTLRSSVSACPAGATLRYQWYAGSKPIKGANAATFKIKRKQLGDRLRVLVTVELPGYTSVMRGSGKTGKAHK